MPTNQQFVYKSICVHHSTKLYTKLPFVISIFQFLPYLVSSPKLDRHLSLFNHSSHLQSWNGIFLSSTIDCSLFRRYFFSTTDLSAVPSQYPSVHSFSPSFTVK